MDNAQVPHPRRLLVAAAVLILTACQANSVSPAPVGSAPPAGGRIQCPSGDHGLDEVELGWGFCYPGTWKYRERLQNTARPRGVDATFDIVNATGAPGPTDGLFGFMIIGTYEKGDSADLEAWAKANLGDSLDLSPITWGNAKAAYAVGLTHQRIALTAHHVVVMDVREGQGNLALDDAMAQRLATWRFDF